MYRVGETQWLKGDSEDPSGLALLCMRNITYKDIREGQSSDVLGPKPDDEEKYGIEMVGSVTSHRFADVVSFTRFNPALKRDFWDSLDVIYDYGTGAHIGYQRQCQLRSRFREPEEAYDSGSTQLSRFSGDVVELSPMVGIRTWSPVLDRQTRRYLSNYQERGEGFQDHFTFMDDYEVKHVVDWFSLLNEDTRDKGEAVARHVANRVFAGASWLPALEEFIDLSTGGGSDLECSLAFQEVRSRALGKEEDACEYQTLRRQL